MCPPPTQSGEGNGQGYRNAGAALQIASAVSLFYAVRGTLKGAKGDIEGAVKDADLAEGAAEAAARDEKFVEPEQLALPLEGAPKAATEAATVPAIAGKTADNAGASGADEAATEAATDRGLEDILDPEQADEFMQRVIGNIRAQDDAGNRIAGGFDFTQDFDPLTGVNPKYLSSERGVVAVAEAIGKTASEHVRGARGPDVQKWDDVIGSAEKLAEEFTTDGATLAANVARLTSQGQDIPATLTALRSIAESSRRNVLRNAEAFTHNRSGENTAQLLNSIQTLANVQGAVKGYSSNIARALNIHKAVLSEVDGVSKALAEIDDPNLINALDPTGASGTAQDALDKLTGRIRSARGNPKRLARILEPSTFQRAQRIAETWYTSSIMSAPGTLVVNFGGGLQQNLLQPLERALGGALAGNRELAQEGIDQLYYTWASTFEAVRVGARAWKSNTPILEGFEGRGNTILGDVDAGGISAADLAVRSDSAVGKVLNGMNWVTNTTFRNILFTDETVRQMAFLGRQRSQFARVGRGNGLSGKRLADYVDTQMDTVYRDGAALRNDKGNIIAEQAAEEGRAAVFQQRLDPGSLSYKTERAIRAVPGSRIFLAPFIRTPINILKTQIRRTPGLRHVLEDVRMDLKSADPSVRAAAEGRMALGTGMYSVAMMLGFSGMFTGAGTGDYRKNRALEQSGEFLPFSFIAPDGKHYSISRNDPIAGHIQVAATVADLTMRAIASGEEDGDLAKMAQDGAGILFTSLVSSLKDKTYLQSLGDFFEAIDKAGEEGSDAGIQRFFGSKAGGFVPSIVAGGVLDASPDPVAKVTNDWLDHVQKRLPGLQEYVDDKYDVFGRKLSNDRGWPLNTLNVSRTSLETSDLGEEYSRLLLTSGKLKETVEKKYRGVDLTKIKSVDGKQSVHARWQELYGSIRLGTDLTPNPSGLTLEETLNALISSDYYRNELTDGQEGVAGTRLEKIGSIMSKYKKEARNALILETPALQDALGEEIDKKKKATEAGSDPIPETGREKQRTVYTDFLRTYRK